MDSRRLSSVVQELFFSWRYLIKVGKSTRKEEYFGEGEMIGAGESLSFLFKDSTGSIVSEFR
jgi:hypothetical protein